ncbi:hypothetical protein ANCCAN_23549 [Ancylostoma caninum]|uniref:EGF-like domain-containing protein n=1 Tax=Ancylostoma caninum TaxID=29170 RepID=A0A368FIP5_ANCCA|nr:hypothetical protein ANCCAN_23549 [Ancylostoma caninum]
MKEKLNFITVTLRNGTTELNRVVPVASSAEIDCQNSAVPGVNKCSCPAGFSTPDCSRPMCAQGILNTWSDVCNCDWRSGGRLCQSEDYSDRSELLRIVRLFPSPDSGL